MKSTKRILVLLMVTVGYLHSFAQTMTYNHDASKCGQIQVMELGDRKSTRLNSSHP